MPFEMRTIRVKVGEFKPRLLPVPSPANTQHVWQQERKVNLIKKTMGELKEGIPLPTTVW